MTVPRVSPRRARKRTDKTDWQQVRAMLDSLPTRAALIGRDRRHLFANYEYAAFLGRTPEEVIGLTVAEAIGGEAFAQLQAFGERALAGATVRWEGWMPYSQGERYVRRVYAPYRGPDGTITGYFVFARDLTDLKARERELAEQIEALEASQATNAAIIASAIDCVIVIDDDRRIVEFNPAAERAFGHRRADVVGRPVGEVIVPASRRGARTAGILRYLDTGEARVIGQRIEVEAMRADGSLFPMELAITEVRVGGRRLFTAYLRDLTEARQAAAEIERQRDALYQSEKMAALGSLLGGVAHELNNPLSVVLGQSLMLVEAASGDDAREELAVRAERIRVAAERCARIVRSFLAMARQRKAERRQILVRDLIDGVLDLLAYGLRSAGIEVTVEVPPDLPPVWADGDQLHQVLVNLVVNAKQALEEGKTPRRILVTAQIAAPEGDLVLTVADNGAGVPEAIRSRIFDPFFTTKPPGTGTGIGLAVSRGLVEAHGGSLVLADDASGGARFVLRLPLGAGVAEGTAAVRPPPAASASRRRILVVDDEPEIAGLLAEILTGSGFDCALASGGAAARDLLAGTGEWDAIVCDLRMPDIDGPALYSWLLANRADLAARTVFITGDTLGPAAGRFLSETGRPVVEKPFVPDEVRRIVASVFAG